MIEAAHDAHPLVARYLRRFPDESGRLESLRHQLEADPQIDRRSNMAGHLTSGALLLDAAAREVLLVDHVFLRQWLAPGGHYEGPGTLWQSAAREVLEETGQHAVGHPWTLAHDIPLDIDTHAIPPRPERGEGAHVHHDFLFLALAASRNGRLQAQAGEVHAACWRPTAVMAESDDPRARRVHAKLVALGLL